MATNLIDRPAPALSKGEIVWMGTLIHGTYHSNIPDTWRQCPMILCEFLRGKANKLDQELPQ